MPEEKPTPVKKSVSPDWFVRGILGKIGETFDRFTGRNWKPSSSLATSELIERLKNLLDSEAKDSGEHGRFVPHNIKLKMQWDKFSTDAENSLKRLEHELLTAAVDHINDRRYHTFAPIKLEIKPDYFTEGVKLLASFDSFAKDERESAVNVTLPDLKNVRLAPPEEIVIELEKEIYTAQFVVRGEIKKNVLTFAERQRRSVGRTKENDLWIDDASVSKIHAALVLNSERQLMVADTGSTNGTFINDERIAYGKATPLKDSDRLRFGTIEIALERERKATEKESVFNADDYQTNKNFALETNSAETNGAESNDNKEEETYALTERKIVLDYGEQK
jgi:pSer/pThr/pTyr-binding forkhead associated (FHA) protein